MEWAGVTIAFTEDSYESVESVNGGIQVTVAKNVQIASAITLNIAPKTVQQFMVSNSGPLPWNIRDNPNSPPYAGTTDNIVIISVSIN